MPIDPSIILGIKPAQVAAYDPLESASKSLTLKHLMGQQDLQAMQLKQAQQAEADDLATRAEIAAGGGTQSVIDRLMGKGLLKPAQALQEKMLAAEKSRVGIDKDKIEIVNKETAAHRDQLANVNDPQTAAQWVMSGYQNPYLKDVFARAGTPEQAIARIPQDPAAFQQWKQQNALGATKFIELNKPTYHDIGGSIMAVPGLGGAPQKFADKTSTPDAILTDARTRSEGAANRGVTLRGQNMTDARARETLAQGKWTNDLERGIQINGQTGETRPITQAGAPIGLREKLTDSQKKELSSIDSQQNILKGALAEVEKTPDAFGTVRGLATMAGAIPESMAGKLDTPAQREARSYVYNVVSKVINERAGAAQSAQELARLRSFLPAETDNAQQIKDKLNSFGTYLENSRAGYDKPQGVRMPAQMVSGATRSGPVAQPGGVKFLGFEDGKK